ncbi:MAG: DUF3394 domain-containing protein, partial [Hyphomicrobiales bacterium]
LLDLPQGATGEERLKNAGLTIKQDGGKTIIDDVGFDTPAKKAGLDWDQEILEVLKPVGQPSKFWMYIPAVLVLLGVIWMQRRRMPATSDGGRAAKPKGA